MSSITIEMLAARIYKLEQKIFILQANKSKLLTEDTGKVFEMAICICKDIIYDGNYKYSIEEPKKLADRLKKSNFNTYFPGIYKHTAKNGARYDFTNDDDKKSKYLSAKYA